MGNWGKNLLREFSKIYTISHCISSGNKENISWLVKNYPQIIFTSDFESILKISSIKTIVIATPISTHFNLALLSLKSGKNVFVEKTIAETSKQGLELLRLAEQNNLCLFVGHIFNYHPIFQKILELNENEDIQFIKFNWLKPESSDENIFLDLLSHDLFLILKLFGKPISIKLLFSFEISNKTDIISIEVKFPTKKCIIDINRCHPYKSKTVSFQTNKGFYVWENYSLFKLDTESKQFQLFYDSNKSSLDLECKAFAEMIKNGPSYDNAQLSIDVLKLIEQIKK